VLRTTATVRDHVVAFGKPGVDRSAKATLLAALGPNHIVRGAVFEIASEELGNLDACY
jgi:hypothetical protein